MSAERGGARRRRSDDSPGTKKVGNCILAETVESKTFHTIDRRLAEISRLVRFRHGTTVPEADDTDLYLIPIADTLAALLRDRPNPGCKDPALTIAERLRIWCPEFPAERARAIAEDAITANRRWTAADLGDRLNLTIAERIELHIRTFRPAGLRGRKWTEYLKERERERDTARRRAKGAVCRKERAAERAALIAASGKSESQFDRDRKMSREAKDATGYACRAPGIGKHIPGFQSAPVLHPYIPGFQPASVLREPTESAAEEARRLGVHRSTVLRRRRASGCAT